MPLLLHNWKDTTTHDLRTTLAPSYVCGFARVLLRLLPRPISAPSLTALLATLSGMFKYLLVPSIKLDLLDQTWSYFRAVLPTCSPEVQRAAAEVWGSVLYQLKRSLIASLIDCHLTSDTADLSYTLLRRVLAALIHHCNGSGQFSVVASLVVDLFCTLSQAEDRAMRITSVVCSVHQGSRLSSSHLTQLSSRLASLSLDASFHSVILSFTSSLLTAGDMAMSAGPGHAFVIRALGVPPLGCYLGEVDIVWKRSVDSWIQKRLSSWEISDEWIDDLYNILSLLVFRDSLPLLLQISHANAAWVIGTCMHALSRYLSAWTKIVDRWLWSEMVLKGLVALLEAWNFPDFFLLTSTDMK
ncbi:hypothetical protein M405DRAFT_874409 [Rhizopogon salebrosus TDB-379]|nr:hypothetical protein M405DRAFT_874409 [Rhizopogon salebrosus TDB-379]